MFACSFCYFWAISTNRWELADPAGYTDALEQHGILGDAPGTIDRKTRGLGKKKLLVQIGVTDTTVNGIAAGYLIRSLGGRAFRGNAYETSFALRKGFAMRYGIQRKDTDTADPFTGFGWVEKARGVQVETAASTAHTVVTSFAMGPRVPILPFFNYPPPLWKAAPYDTHERVRLHPLAQLQIGLFFRVYLNQIRRGGGVHDGFVWVENVCEAEGCWNLDRPPKVVSAPSASKIVFQQQSSP